MGCAHEDGWISRRGAQCAHRERNTYQQAIAFLFSFGLKFFFLFL